MTEMDWRQLKVGDLIKVYHKADYPENPKRNSEVIFFAGVTKLSDNYITINDVFCSDHDKIDSNYTIQFKECEKLVKADKFNYMFKLLSVESLAERLREENPEYFI